MIFLKTTIFLSFMFLLSACNPLGKLSSMNLIFDDPPAVFSGQDKTEVNAGGKTAPTVPASGNPAEVHTVTYSIGGVFNQTSYKTADGHIISISIKGATQ